MAISIQAKTDYSYLFSGFGSSSGSSSANLNFLTDYALIKNGSYGKLMKAYYSENSSDELKSIARKNASNSAVTEVEEKALTKVQTASDELKESADALLATGSKSLFAKKAVTSTDESGAKHTTEEYDREGIYKAASAFVSDYNAVIRAVDDAGNEKVTRRGVTMAAITASNEKLLNKIGITINSDSTLSMDEATFKNADMGTVKTLFNGTGSYGYRVSAQASMIDFAAASEASRNSTYTAGGTLNNSYRAGNLFSTYF